VILEAADVRFVGTSESIATVLDLEVLADGSVWVINSVAPFFVGFGPDGEPLEEYGTQGGGPDEFGAPAGFVFEDLSEEGWVLDPRRHLLVQVPRPGSGRSEIALPREPLPPGSLQPGMGLMTGQMRAARMGDEVVVARSFGSLQSGVYSLWSAIWGADLVGFDPGDGSTRDVLSLGESLGDPTDFLEQTNGFPPFPLWLRLWTVCSDDRIRVHDRLRNEIRTFMPDGSETEPVALPSPPFESVTDEQFASAVYDLRRAEVSGRVGGRITAADSVRVFNEMVQGVEGTPEGLARFLPRYVDMRCADDASTWLQPLDLDLGNLKGGRTWLRVTPEGSVREVHLPPRFDAYRFRGGRAWGVQRDEFDVASVGWVALPSGF